MTGCRSYRFTALGTISDSMLSRTSGGAYGIKAYGFAELGGVHVLLIANSTFDNGDGTKASDDAYVYVNGDNGAVLCGQLTSGGTAYPISVKGDAFVTGNRAGIVLNTIGEDNALVEAEGTDADYEEAVAVAFIE